MFKQRNVVHDVSVRPLPVQLGVGKAADGGAVRRAEVVACFKIINGGLQNKIDLAVIRPRLPGLVLLDASP